MDIDGEYFVHKTRVGEGEPRIQLIESHRIGDPYGSRDTIDGVGLDAWGAPIFYRVLEDSGKSRDLPSTSVLTSARKSSAAPAMRSSFLRRRQNTACRSRCCGSLRGIQAFSRR